MLLGSMIRKEASLRDQRKLKRTLLVHTYKPSTLVNGMEVSYMLYHI